MQILNTLDKLERHELYGRLDVEFDSREGSKQGQAGLFRGNILLTDQEQETAEIIGEITCFLLERAEKEIAFYHKLNADLMSVLDAAASTESDNTVSPNILHIDRIYLKPEYRGKGIGSAILPFLVDFLGKSASVVTILGSPPKNKLHCQALLESLEKLLEFYGFRRAKQHVGVWVKVLRDRAISRVNDHSLVFN